MHVWINLGKLALGYLAIVIAVLVILFVASTWLEKVAR